MFDPSLHYDPSLGIVAESAQSSLSLDPHDASAMLTDSTAKKQRRIASP